MAQLGNVMCGVCGLGLNKLHKSDFGETTVTSGWAHANEVYGKVDHPAVPVPYDEGFAVSVCDFCESRVPLDQRQYLPVDNFEIGLEFHHPDGRLETHLYQNRGGYGCCTFCADLVREDNWDGLAERYRSLHQNIPLGALEIIWGETRKNITGPVREWRDGDHLVEE